MDVHLALDKVFDALAACRVGARGVLLVRALSDGDGDLPRHVTDAFDGREDAPAAQLGIGSHAREGDRSVVEHRVAHALGRAHARAKAHPGEDVHIVALRRRELIAVVTHRVKGRPGRDDRAPVRPLIRFAWGDLAPAGAVSIHRPLGEQARQGSEGRCDDPEA